VVLHPGRQDPWRCGEVIGGGDHVDDLDELRATGLGLDHSSAADLGDLLRAAKSTQPGRSAGAATTLMVRVIRRPRDRSVDRRAGTSFHGRARHAARSLGLLPFTVTALLSSWRGE
jgi:hypothetical protein